MSVKNRVNATAAEYLFKKLRPFEDDDGNIWFIPELMECYMKKERESGHAWFSMPSHISEGKVRKYNQKIQSGNRVRILFGVNDENVDNDIGYSADVLEMLTSTRFVSCPEESGEIPEFPGETNKTWIKIRRLKEERDIRADMLKITSNGASLKDRICRSQCHFAYVSLK